MKQGKSEFAFSSILCECNKFFGFFEFFRQVQGELYATSGYNYPYNENEFNTFPRLEDLDFGDVDYANDLYVFS